MGAQGRMASRVPLKGPKDQDHVFVVFCTKGILGFYSSRKFTPIAYPFNYNGERWAKKTAGKLSKKINETASVAVIDRRLPFPVEYIAYKKGECEYGRKKDARTQAAADS